MSAASGSAAPLKRLQAYLCSAAREMQRAGGLTQTRVPPPSPPPPPSRDLLAAAGFNPRQRTLLLWENSLLLVPIPDIQVRGGGRGGEEGGATAAPPSARAPLPCGSDPRLIMPQASGLGWGEQWPPSLHVQRVMWARVKLNTAALRVHLLLLGIGGPAM